MVTRETEGRDGHAPVLARDGGREERKNQSPTEDWPVFLDGRRPSSPRRRFEWAARPPTTGRVKQCGAMNRHVYAFPTEIRTGTQLALHCLDGRMVAERPSLVKRPHTPMRVTTQNGGTNVRCPQPVGTLARLNTICGADAELVPSSLN